MSDKVHNEETLFKKFNKIQKIKILNTKILHKKNPKKACFKKTQKLNKIKK